MPLAVNENGEAVAVVKLAEGNHITGEFAQLSALASSGQQLVECDCERIPGCQVAVRI